MVLGAQWGDEGKGKIIDYLANDMDIVVRASGGANAGHTVVIERKKYALHLVPSGVLNKNAMNIVGNGVVFDIEEFLEELSVLEKDGVNTKNIFLSDRAHIVFPYHKRIDALKEDALGDKKIGTTIRGIGPCYMDKIERIGLRLGDLRDDDFFEKLGKNVDEKNKIIEKIYNSEPLNKDEIISEYKVLKEKIIDRVVDTSLLVENAVLEGKSLLYEGAQATMLDIDHGTYPFVTSSNPTSGGFSTGIGISPLYVDRIIGVAKAYTTRVGEGPFVSELNDEIGDLIREAGHEYGTTTGRPRRCGYLDTVVLRYAKRVNGLTEFALMLLDVLDNFEELKVCTGYEVDGKVIKEFPASLHTLSKAKPVYEVLRGWNQDTTKCRTFEELPDEAKEYISLIEKETGVKVSIISVGADRNQTIVRD